MRMPSDFEDVMKAAKKRAESENKLSVLRPIAADIVSKWEKKPEAEKAIVNKIFKDFSKFIDALKSIKE